MLKISTTPLFLTWVKNVYSLCVDGRVTGAQSYTGSLTASLEVIHLSAQAPQSTNTINRFEPTLYTAFFSHLPDTTNHLSTLSTAPTIEKTKKYMKGNY